MLRRIGVELPRATFAHWRVKASELIAPLVAVMREDLLGGDILQRDETTVQGLKEPGRSPTTPSSIWVQRGGSPKRPILLFSDDPSRRQATAERLLGGFQGYLQTDGYDGYTTPAQPPASCMWAASPTPGVSVTKPSKPKTSIRCRVSPETALGYIRELYRIEKPLREVSAEARYPE
jgi:hypothetical protein